MLDATMTRKTAGMQVTLWAEFHPHSTHFPLSPLQQNVPPDWRIVGAMSSGISREVGSIFLSHRWSPHIILKPRQDIWELLEIGFPFAKNDSYVLFMPLFRAEKEKTCGMLAFTRPASTGYPKERV